VSYEQEPLFADDEREQALPTSLRGRRRRVRPAEPTRSGRPRQTYGPSESFLTDTRPPSPYEDSEIWEVRDAIKAEDPHGFRTGYAIREALDQIYDGQRTGRWDYTQLLKTEKTHVGTLVEIWLQREFQFSDGIELDYQIAGVDVDCKWSLNLYEWEIPQEMYSRGEKIALVVWGNEYTARWASGLVRIGEDFLKPPGKQRDGKRKLNDRGRDRILWIKEDGDLVKNTLLHIRDPAKLRRIVYASSGQKAVDILFRELTGELINRATVVTVAQQVDSAKRVRQARARLRDEGIVIFGHYDPHPRMARELGLAAPSLGRFVSARLAPWRPGEDLESCTEIDGTLWRLASEYDPVVRAPALPRQGKEGDQDSDD
jgi:hypothetical protein